MKQIRRPRDLLIDFASQFSITAATLIILIPYTLYGGIMLALILSGDETLRWVACIMLIIMNIL